ncbi:DUF6093 family protein [Leucobacter sp. G161]|uniref:DUF6093 family protein n=1 Tax=Leucobacter sp. G161 TaxID=663704 RepID=UPI00073C39A0|nr:DUF6093 family protein [Leucobacter sp. G161]KUF07187.1 hypothetical protein AUL38_02555 [Leucobacter sp. G161]
MSILTGTRTMGAALAESRMTETVTVGRFEKIRRPGEFDPILTLVETYYTGKARVKFPSASANEKSPAGQQLAETRIIVSLPSAAARAPTGALVRVDASTVDTALTGRMFRVDGSAQAGQTTAHRYPVTEES